MPFDERLAARIRELLSTRSDVTEKKMFGGLAFLSSGHMCCGIVGQDLMVRVGAEGHEQALAQAHARPMDFTGKPLRGMVYVAQAGLGTEDALRAWLDRGVSFVAKLPPKSSAPAERRRPRKGARAK